MTAPGNEIPSWVVWRWSRFTPDAVAQARVALRCALGQLGFDEETMDNAVLVVSEIVTNAIKHAEGPYQMRLRRTVAEVICEVEDGDPQLPTLIAFPAASPLGPEGENHDDSSQASVTRLRECGRGLHIVHKLTNGVWGFRSRRGVKVAWFAFPLPHREGATPT